MSTLIFLSIIIFLLGLYFYSKFNDPNYKEGLVNMDKQPSCPNLLIQKDSKFYLYNSKLASVPGVNPIEFNNLEDYVEFLDWQKSQGIQCPVLYLQRSYDTQGNSSTWSAPRQNCHDSSLHPFPPAAPHHCTAQPTTSHTSQGHPQPHPTRPDNPRLWE